MGSLFSNLSKSTVGGRDFSTPQAAAEYASGQIPSVESMAGGSVLNPTFNAPSLPTIQTNIPTSKAKVLSLLLSGGLGAAAASGARTGGEGAMRAYSLLSQIDEDRQRAQAAEQERQIRAAQLSLLPVQQQTATANLANVQAQTSLHKAQADALAAKPDADTNSSLALMLAHATAAAIQNGVDPSQDPTVKQIQGVIDAGQKDPSNDPVFRAWQKENPNGTVADFLKLRYPKQQINVGGLPPADHEAMIQGLLDGTLSLQALGRMGSGEKMKLAAEAKRRDPSFDMTTYPSRLRVAEDFASGKSADQIQSFNTFLAHARDLSNAVNDFRTTGSPLINKPMNWLRKNSGDPVIASYLAKIQPVQDEFMTFLQANHALTESDKQSAQKILDPSLSPAQMQAVIKSISHTAALRLTETNKRYRNTMKKDYPGLIEPENAQFLQDVGASGSGSTQSNNGSGFFANIPGAKVR